MTQTGRTLVAFFSWSGATRKVATCLAERLGADLFEIVPVDPYPADFEATMQRAEAESAARARPGIAAEPPELSSYDTVFLGSPVWTMSPPGIMLSFVERVDLKGRLVVPFVTSAATGLSGITEAYRKALPGVTVADGLAVPNGEAADCSARVEEWLAAG